MRRIWTIFITLATVLLLVVGGVSASGYDGVHYYDGDGDGVVDDLLRVSKWTELDADYFSNHTNTLPKGSYYLSDDLTITETIYIESNVNLCLNGHTIQYAQNGYVSVITIGSLGTLNLFDGEAGDGLITGGTGTVSVVRGTKWFHGGGVYNNGTLNMYGGTIGGNHLATNGNGGGVYVYDVNATFNMYGGSISGNTVGNHGGGVYSNGSVTMYSCDISGNTADGVGGGIYESTGETFAISDSVLSGNVAGQYGGGLYSSVTATISDTSITGNASARGGGIYHINKLTMTDCVTSGNTATVSGGGIYSAGTLIMTNSSITGNGSDGVGVTILPLLMSFTQHLQHL